MQTFIQTINYITDFGKYNPKIYNEFTIIKPSLSFDKYISRLNRIFKFNEWELTNAAFIYDQLYRNNIYLSNYNKYKIIGTILIILHKFSNDNVDINLSLVMGFSLTPCDIYDCECVMLRLINFSELKLSECNNNIADIYSLFNIYRTIENSDVIKQFNKFYYKYKYSIPAKYIYDLVIIYMKLADIHGVITITDQDFCAILSMFNFIINKSSFNSIVNLKQYDDYYDIIQDHMKYMQMNQ